MNYEDLHPEIKQQISSLSEIHVDVYQAMDTQRARRINEREREALKAWAGFSHIERHSVLDSVRKALRSLYEDTTWIPSSVTRHGDYLDLTVRLALPNLGPPSDELLETNLAGEIREIEASLR